MLFDVFDSSLSAGDISLSLIELSAVVVIHDLDQDIAAVDTLEVLDKYPADIAGNLCGQWCRIGPKVGVSVLCRADELTHQFHSRATTRMSAPIRMRINTRIPTPAQANDLFADERAKRFQTFVSDNASMFGLTC